MKSSIIMVFAPTPLTPSNMIVSVPSMVTWVLAPRSTMATLAAKSALIDPEQPNVQHVLAAAGRIGVEPRDRVVAEPRSEHERVVAGHAVHDVVAGTADHDVVTGIAVERIDAEAADERVGAAAAAEASLPAPPVITLFDPLPVPVKSPTPVKVKFSTLPASVNVLLVANTELMPVLRPHPRYGIAVVGEIGVIAQAADQRVVAQTAGQRVVAGAAVQVVHEPIAGQRVVAGPAGDVLDACDRGEARGGSRPQVHRDVCGRRGIGQRIDASQQIGRDRFDAVTVPPSKLVIAVPLKMTLSVLLAAVPRIFRVSRPAPPSTVSAPSPNV